MTPFCSPPEPAPDAPPKAASKAAPQAADAIECFTPGTQIATPQGPRAAQELSPGDKVLTRDNGFQPLIWAGARRARFDQGTALPVVISAGALGPGQPARPTVVSATHKVLCAAQTVAPSHAEPEVLVEAQALVGAVPGVVHVQTCEARYVHLLLERHEVILANGAWMESFRLSRPAAAILRAARCAPVLAAFPGLRRDATGALHSPARCILPGILGFGPARPG